jgi:hypothetical protein
MNREDPNACDVPRGGTIVRQAACLRQWRYPREFRIAPVAFPKRLGDVVEKLLQALVEERDVDRRKPIASDRLLADLGTNLWRLRKRMLEPGTDQPSEAMRRPFRHVQSIWDALADAGIEICDHTGEMVPKGGNYALRILACQPTPGINRDIVLETIKPTVRFGDKILQQGEVILGTPVAPVEGPPSPAQDPRGSLRRESGPAEDD